MKCRRKYFLGSLLVLLGVLAVQAQSWAQEENTTQPSSEGTLLDNQPHEESNHQNAEQQIPPSVPETSDSGPDAKKLIEEVELALQKVREETGKDPGAVAIQPSPAVSLQQPVQTTSQPPPPPPPVTVVEDAGKGPLSSNVSADGPAPPVLLEAFVDKSAVTIGEQIKYSIVVDSEKDVEVEFPQFGDNLGGFGVKDFQVSKPQKSGWNRIKREQWYLLDSYTVGSYVIPPQSVRVKLADGKSKTLTSPEIFVEVKSVLGQGPAEGGAGLRDIKAPLEIPSNMRLLLGGVLGVLMVLGLLGVTAWMFYMKRLKGIPPAPPLPAHEAAYRELARIEGLDLVVKGQVKEYYYLVSNCLRTYLEDRFSLRAPEQTTEEFLESVSQGDALEGRHINLLKDYLRHCDLVKYAKLEPDRTQTEELIAKTRRFIDETKQFQEESSELEEVEA